MGHFPFFMEIQGVKAVVAGGGTVAARKVEKLLPFGPAITVLAPAVCPRLERLLQSAASQKDTTASLTVIRRPVSEDDLTGAAFVIAATDDDAVNASVSEYCKRHSIPVNVADDREKCTFFFPALVRDGALTVGISTDGKSPAAAAFVRRRVEKALPDSLGSIIGLLGELREEALKLSCDQEKRAYILERLFSYSLQKDGDVTPEELRACMRGMGQEGIF